ncbi:hypothetical protein [Lentisalinibacter salinarum]|uniref:hypothetical protein n=2 Tax=Lentisalinibacter salinarum TaxID=2992239 RepID=UPI003869D3A4
MDWRRAMGSNPRMRRLTAIAVIVSILAASAGELAHACAMDILPQPAAKSVGAAVNDGDAAMPCHGAERQTAGHVMDQSMDRSMDRSMNCCDEDGPATHCIDCLCTAVSMPLSALESAIAQALPAPARHALPLSAAPPPERAPEYLLRPPIVVS